MLRLTSITTLAALAVYAPAQLTLPYSGTDISAAVSAFQIVKSGTSGRANTLYITNAANTSDALLVNTVGTGRAGYFTINSAGNSNPAIRADSNGGGAGVFGFMTGTGRAGYFRITNASNTNSAMYAQTNGSGPAILAQAGTGLAGDFQGKVRIAGNIETFSNISVAAGSNPQFPITFPDTFGDKIHFFGPSAGSHYGIGVQSGALQIYSHDSNSAIAFGYGGSGGMFERMRMTGTATFTYLPFGQKLATEMKTPYDLKIQRDFNSNDTDAWFRVFTDNTSFEQFRIEDGDEASARFDGAIVANGIDFAEAFKVMDSSLEPGDLVVNHGLDWEYISKSSGAYDARVIGVVSTKPAFIAGMSFDAEDKIDPELTARRNAARAAGNDALEKELTNRMIELVKRVYRPVAFIGRVPVKVMGAVKVGDHLTASNVPGVAMAMTKPGQSIGIALETNAGGYGKIMVMVQPGHFSPIVPVNSIAYRALSNKVDQLWSENAALKERLDRLEAQMSRQR